MSEEITGYIDPNKPISVRFNRDEAEFINENYERIAGVPERITTREFFFAAVQQAVTLVKPKVAEKQRPEDAAAIAELRARIDEANMLIESKDAYIAEITQRDIEQLETVNQLNGSIDRLNARIEELENRPEPEPPMPENIMILEDMLPVETALVMEYARLMNATPKTVLVEKLFVPTVWHGPGDYIPHLTGAAKRRIKETF